MKKKKCTGCNKTKSLDLFNLDNKAADKKTSRCKECMAAYKRNRKKQEIVAFIFAD